MKRLMANHKQKKAILIALAAPLMFSPAPLMAVTGTSEPVVAIARQAQTIVSVQQINPTTVDVVFSNNQRMTFDFYGDNIFRMFQDNNGGILRDPEAKPEARILVDTPRRPVSKLDIQDDNGQVTITTGKVRLQLDKSTALLKVTNLTTNKIVFEETKPVVYEKGETILTLKENPDEYFYGGGVQNGRFSHKGKAIAIENQNSWTDGGVASPTPFYWSTNGYGFMWYTFKQGKYDFGATEKNTVKLSHDTDYLDVFYMINDSPVALLNDFYQLTGNPILLPKFGFYQGHLNAYNRDYWVEDEKGILFEDGKRYKESQKDNGGIKESLNGEKNNYQFSARAVIDRYKNHDMPLGWLLPNDGYGAGYGQTETLDGNIQNLKSLTDYAHKNGVEIGLWTQSDLHPKDSISALLQRDIVKEVRDAGVRVLKTDVAWVGWGYSFGLNGVADVGHIMPYYGNDARPFIISLDGWAGTQRYAGVWSGDQTGGQWEYIRFHIPTYIGSGLSGQPNITSDMDGIFGGKNLVMNTRDFQWKTWTPMELNMDGWGSNEKYPHALGEPATSINPVTVQVLGICSALAVTAKLEPAIVMGLSVTVITAFSNVVISLLRKTIPNRIRIIVQLVVVAALVTIVSEILKAFAYDVSVQLSVYVGLIITNCILMGRLEAFAMQNGPWESFLDGVGNGLGYAKILVIVAFFRELLGSGTLLGFNILNYEPLQKIGYVNNGLMLMPPMALILCACIIWYQRARHKELQEK